MRFYLIPIVALLAVIGGFAPALAAPPRTIADCEKIQAADAYNQCLASFGPVAHIHAGSQDAPAAAAAAKGTPHRQARRHGQGGSRHYARGRSHRGRPHYTVRGHSAHGHGRQRMQFAVGHRHRRGH